MEPKSKRNGQHGPEPMFALICDGFAVVPAYAILEILERNGIEKSKTNLALGPVFRTVADSFRDWSKIAEPGTLFQAPEIALRVIRLVACPPLSTALSEAAQAKIREQQEQPNPRIAMP